MCIMDNEKAIAEFISLTGVTRATALRALNAAGGDLQVATEQFFNSMEGEGKNAEETSYGLKNAASHGVQSSSTSRRGGGGMIRSLSDYRGSSGPMDEGEDDEDTNDYFAGGEKSGQIVRGAPKNPSEGGKNSALEDIFDGARRYGATEQASEGVGSSTGSFRAFDGPSRTLGGSDIYGGAAALGQMQGSGAVEGQQDVKVEFYENNVFTVDDGEPRRMDDPDNEPFLSAIMNGRLPPELDPGNPRIVMNVNLVRRNEPYDFSARPKFRAFAGTGRKLNTSSERKDEEKELINNPPVVSPRGVAWEGADSNKPTTNIQLRLGDGSRLVAQFNLDHTVGDIRRFLQAVRSDMSTNYILSTAFPKKELDDDSVTIEDAGLRSSVVIQKML